MRLNGWHSSLGQKYSVGGQSVFSPTGSDLPQVSAFLGAMQRCSTERELTWRTSLRAWGKSPTRYWDASLLVLQGPIDLGCLTILLQKPYFLLFNTISQAFLCIGLKCFEIFGARIISSFKFEIYSGWVSVFQFILSWSLITALQIINKRTGHKMPQELQSSEW